ncbi:MAG: glycosyltransferase family 39 protein, partial [Pseudomonadota bacterium]
RKGQSPAMGALARIYGPDHAPSASRRWSLLFWAALGASFLIKGPVTLLVAGLAIVAISLFRRDFDWAKPLRTWQGIGLFALLVLPWFIWVQIATAGEFLEGAVGKDLKDKLVGASEGHGGPPGYHLAFLATHFFPATLFLVPGLVLAARVLRHRALETLAEDRTGLAFLAAWLVPTWTFFECLPTKLSHYILPAYPALALICGWGALRLMDGAKAPVSRAASFVLFLIGAGALGLAISPWGLSAIQSEAALDFRTAADAPEVLASWAAYLDMPTACLACAAAGTAAVAIAAIVRLHGVSVFLAIATSLFLGWHIRAVALPGAIWAQPTTSARLALAEVCGLPQGNADMCTSMPPTHVQAVGYAEPSLVFTTGTATTIPPQTVIALPADMAAYPVSYLLNIEDPAGLAARQLISEEATARALCSRISNPVFALNYSNGDPVAFVGLRIDAGPCSADP